MLDILGVTVTRLHFEGNNPGMGSGGTTDTIVWAVQTTPIDIMLRGFLTELGAVGGESHPDLVELVVNTVQVDPTGYGASITVGYTLPEQVDTNFDNPDAPGFFAIDTTFDSTDIEIPIYQKVVKTFGDLVSQEVFQRVENVASFRYTKSVNRITLNAEIIGDKTVTSQLSLVQQLNRQNNKLHRIGGVWYLFEVDGIRRIEKDKYQFTYRWTYDPGVPNTLTTLSIEDSYAVQGSYLYPLAWRRTQTGHPALPFVPDLTYDWVIVPHHRTDVATSGIPSEYPKVDTAPQYLIGSATGVGDGYTLLPGVTL